MIPKLEQHQLLIVYYWDGIFFLIVLLKQGIQECHKSSGRILLCIHLSAREYIFCLLAAHPSYRQSSHFAYTQQSLRGGRTMCLLSDAGHLRLLTNTGVHPNLVDQTKMSMHSRSHSMKPTTRDWVLSDFFSHPEAWNPADRLRAEAKLDGI